MPMPTQAVYDWHKNDWLTVPKTLAKGRWQRSQSTLRFSSTRIERYSKSRRLTYCQHGQECCLQLIKNTNWGFKWQKSQDCKINAVPNCRPYSLINDYFDKNCPPVLERKKFLEKRGSSFSKLSNWNMKSNYKNKPINVHLAELVIIMRKGTM